MSPRVLSDTLLTKLTIFTISTINTIGRTTRTMWRAIAKPFKPDSDLESLPLSVRTGYCRFSIPSLRFRWVLRDANKWTCLMPPLLMGRLLFVENHHIGNRHLCGGSRFVSTCNILAAKSGPGVTDLDFRFRCLRSSRFVTVRP